MAVKPTIPSGTRDFSPEEVYKRQFIFNTIRSVFEKYGYAPIETPTMENLSTLEGKYGEEGDRLLFRILDSGDFFKSIRDQYLSGSSQNLINQLTYGNLGADDTQQVVSQLQGIQSFREMALSDLIQAVSEKGLRYDLTVPFARYVVMHQNEITFPFKRYQIQPVFRADRPQKGRYREFFQCDADVVGSDSLLYDAEFAQIYDEAFAKLNVEVEIKINNRKILQGIAEVCNASEKFMDITIAIDKLDKIGLQGVRQELTNRGMSESQLQLIEKFFSISGNAETKISQALQLLSNSETGTKGCEELKAMLDFLQLSGNLKNDLIIDFTLARGLNYYTGVIYEVVAKSASLKSSVGGGGRYDDLTGVFGLKGVSGVGISFGADRIYDVMEEMKLFPATASKGTQVLFCYFDEVSQKYCLSLVKKVRDEGIAAEIYPSAEKMKKQLKYANDKKIPFVVVVGDNEMKSGKLAFKDMESGEQMEKTIDEIIQQLK